MDEFTQIYLFDEDLTASQMSEVQVSSLRPERTVSLIHQAARGSLVHWRLTAVGCDRGIHRPGDIVGSIVRTKHGRTSPLVAVDPSLRKVLTRSGNVYSLGMPDPAFAYTSPSILSYFGFN